MDLMAGIVGLFISFGILSFMLLLCVAAYALTCIGLMRMFQKAGVEGYKAWIPFYRSYVLCKITMGAGWYFLFSYIPAISILMRAVYAYEVMLSYGESFLYGILYFFFPTIAQLVAGFGGARYLGSQDLAGQVKDMFGGRNDYRDTQNGSGYGDSYRASDSKKADVKDAGCSDYTMSDAEEAPHGGQTAQKEDKTDSSSDADTSGTGV